MAYRTSLAAVQNLSGDFAAMTTAQMLPHIISANHVVTDNVADDSAQTDEKLETLTTFIAAHFATVFVREATDEKAGSVGASYEGNARAGARLESTRFGRMALTLDNTGGLARLNALATKVPVGTMSSLSKTPSTW